MKTRLNAIAFGMAAAVIAALIMMIIGILSRFGIYTEAAAMMSEWHLFFSPTPIGVLAGMVEAAVSTFVFTYLFAALYNQIVTLINGEK
jgi:hypothetical protein